MYRKFDVTGNLFFHSVFFVELNTAFEWSKFRFQLFFKKNDDSGGFPKGEVKIMIRGMYFSPIISAMICCEVQINVLLYVCDPLISFPVCMNLFC
jgi:hypothetical protein